MASPCRPPRSRDHEAAAEAMSRGPRTRPAIKKAAWEAVSSGLVPGSKWLCFVNCTFRPSFDDLHRPAGKCESKTLLAQRNKIVVATRTHLESGSRIIASFLE